MRPITWISVLCFSAVLTVLRAEPPALVAIKDATIITGAGTVLEKGTVVLKDGLIADVGTAVSIPKGAWVIDGSGLTVYPGLIDALSTWGIPEAAATSGAARAAVAPTPATPARPAQTQTTLQSRARGPEDRPQTTSWVMAADLVKPDDRRLDAARTAGFTTAVTFPKDGLIAGHGAVIELGGETSGQMVVEPSVGLYMALRAGGFGGGFPNSLMGVLAYFRQVWIDAAWYKNAKQMYAGNPTSYARPAYDRALEGVLQAHRILLPAGSRVELERIVRFAAELKTPTVLYGAQDAYRATDVLKDAGVAVIVDVKWPTRQRDADPEAEESLRTLTLRDKAPSTPAALAKAGVPFAFSSSGLDAPRDFVRDVKKAIDAGLSKQDAIHALTLGAAKIYGVDNRLGSIEKGKIANVVLVKGDIFDSSSKVQMIFIDGVKYDPAPETPQGPPGGVPGGRRPTTGEEVQK